MYLGEEDLELRVQLLELVVVGHFFEELQQELKVFERTHGGMRFLDQNLNQLLDEGFEKGIIIILIQKFMGILINMKNKI
jgi:hypothetical protein